MEVAAASSRIADRFFDLIDFSDVKKLHTFIRISKFNEVDTSNIYYRIWREWPDVATYAPKSDLATNSIRSIVFDSKTGWTENEWNIREPIGTEAAAPEQLDIVIVPLLCFDQTGHRIGYGKGFYDRLLSQCRQNCKKIGLSIFPHAENIATLVITTSGLTP